MVAERGTLRQWPNWAGYAAGSWAVLFGAMLLATGRGALYGVGWLGWVGAAVLTVGAGLALVSVRGGRWAPSRLVAAGLWSVVLVALAGSAFVLLDLISWAMNGAMLGRDGRSDWGPFAERLGFVGVAVLFSLTALAWRYRTGHSCPRCGLDHPADAVVAVERPVVAASDRMRLIAHLGAWRSSPTMRVI